MFKSSLISTKTGTALQAATAHAVAINELAGIITSSPNLTPQALGQKQ